MFEANVGRALDLLGDEDLVLDVGGWACPFNRAQWVLDAEPFDTRGFYRSFGGPPSQGGDREWFDRSRWIQRDICDGSPWPFGDKQFDFAICSHTLEDVRDPLRVCSELVRVARAGYIETPSRVFECCRGAESSSFAGLSHHRWLIDYEERAIRFLMKFHFLHEGLPWSLPPAALRKLSPEARVSFLWWHDSFEFSESTIHGQDQQRAECEAFLRHSKLVPAWRLSANRAWRSLSRLLRRMARGAARRLHPD